MAVPVARQTHRAELPQNQQHRKGRRSKNTALVRRDAFPRRAPQHRAQVEQAVAAGRNAQPPHVPSGQPAAPAHPQQHAGKKSLRQQRIGTMQQPLQNKFHQSVQNRYLKQCLDEPHRAAQLGTAVKHAPVHGAANHILHRHGRCDGIAGNLQNALITRQNIQL